MKPLRISINTRALEKMNANVRFSYGEKLRHSMSATKNNRVTQLFIIACVTHYYRAMAKRMKQLLSLGKEEITQILLDAMDNGNWHTPSVGQLTINHEHTSNACIAGSFVTSLHNTYRDLERKFEINQDAVRIWEDRQMVNLRGDLVTDRLHRPIYCIDRIVERLNAVPDVESVG